MPYQNHNDDYPYPNPQKQFRRDASQYMLYLALKELTYVEAAEVLREVYSKDLQDELINELKK